MLRTASVLVACTVEPLSLCRHAAERAIDGVRFKIWDESVGANALKMPISEWFSVQKPNHEGQAWRSWPLAKVEREYSPSSCVPSLSALLAEYAARSRDAEERLNCKKDLNWGEGADDTLDFFPADSADAPLLVFFHGGYWQELSKNESLFPAPDCVANGIAYAAINYALAPLARVDTIVDHCPRAIAWLLGHADALGFDPRRLFVAGSSAGAHLTAMLLVSGWQRETGLS